MLTGGRKCVIFQLIDDHSRYAVASHLASHVASSETAEAAIAVFDKAVAAHGVPQRLLSDNGIALNPSRRGYLGQLVEHVASLGVEAITGKPYKPTTQGKNERFHQNLFRYLDKQPLADTLAESYRPKSTRSTTPTTPNAPPRTTRTGHTPDGLGGHTEGRGSSSQARPALPCRGRHQAPSTRAGARRPARRHHRQKVDQRRHLHAGRGPLHGRRTLRLQQVLAIVDGDKITVADLDGEILIEHTRPAPGTTYVGNGRPRGPRQDPEPSPMS